MNSSRGRLRVIAGAAKGTPLKIPHGEVRPTLDRVREALFSIIGPSIEGGRFLDLYAGSGANGIEALSRGAAYTLFIDSDPIAIECIRSNLARIRVLGSSRVVRATLPKDVGAVVSGDTFDYVFADPPYALDEYDHLIGTVAADGILRPGGRLIVEHEARRDLSTTSYPSMTYVRTYRYGGSALTVFQYGTGDDSQT